MHHFSKDTKSTEHIEVEVPPVSMLAGIADPSSYWPSSMAHLALPYDNVGTDYVTIAEISEAPVAGYIGYKKISVALVPYSLVDEVLHSTAATGWEVESQGPLPIVDGDDPPHKSGFWIEGIRRDTRFEPLINCWHGSDTEVVVPDNNMLMVFGLVPRQTGESEISWDDPHGPVYDVVRTSTISDHQRAKESRQRAYVEIRRDYLLEYCRIKQCAAVAFFYEQRLSSNDLLFDQVIRANDSVDFNLPGRLLNLQIQHHRADRGHQYAQVWGRRIVLLRGERKIIAMGEPELVWPDHPGIMTVGRAGHEHLMAYVSDEVLKDYERRQEYEIYPLSGGVSYRGQWSVSYCHRVGRGHIAIELKKLYEGSGNAVIEHWHRFGVNQAKAEADEATNGDRNIGIRAEELVKAYLAMTSALSLIIERLGLGFDQIEVGGYSSQNVEYKGWWLIDELSSLADVVPLEITRDEFLDRACNIVIFLESLQQSPLRNMLLKLGVDKQYLANHKSIKLLATLCQLACVAKEAGHHWPDDSAHFLSAWDKDSRIPSMRRLFAVNQLRIKAAHRTGTEFANSLAADLKVFGIQPAVQAAGWGRAVDSIYDGLIEDLTAITTILVPSN